MKSARLTYRELELSDAPRIAMLAGDWDVASMTARIPYPYTHAEAGKWIGGLTEKDYVRGVVLDGELIGAAGYFHGSGGSAEIGYWIGRPWWGNGYATEAAQALVRHCFTEAGIRRLTCCHFTDNTRSARVIEKLGFKMTGPCSAFCEARRQNVAIVRYERGRPLFSFFRRRAA